jgi:DedD protein
VLSFLKRKDSPAPAVALDEAATVQAARTRARRRLIGAALLVGIGIIGFPLIFETQPRPIAVDIPIEIPARDGVPPLRLPVAEEAAATPPRAASSVAAGAPTPVESATPATKSPVEPASAARPAAPTATLEAEAQRAQALLDGKPVAMAPPAAPSSAAKAPRFVVQAGAYTDAAALREARQKVEKLGLKTYTQVIQTDSGERTRVRVGPFDTREEADKAAARIKGSGLAANVLSL